MTPWAIFTSHKKTVTVFNRVEQVYFLFNNLAKEGRRMKNNYLPPIM